jgi:transmembrane sensor
VKDPETLRAPSIAQDVLNDSAMDQALNWLIELDNDDLEQQARFQAWLAADPAHRTAFDRVHAVWHSQPVKQAAKALQPSSPAFWRRCTAAYWKPLATAAVLLIAVFNFSNLGVRLQADHLTAVGERQRLQLEDGSRVLLNTHSALSSDMTGKGPVAHLLQGEAFFEVPASLNPPLEVQAGTVSMRSSDSAFAVRYLNGVAQIFVERGALNVRTPQNNAQVVLAGDSISVDAKGASHRQALDRNADLAWVQGRLVFDNCPLSDVLAELRRYYPGWIVNTNDRLQHVAVTGNYRLDNPIEVVRSLAHITSASLHELPALVILN